MKFDTTVTLKIAAVFLMWRSIIFIIGSLAQNILPYKPSFPYAYDLLPKYNFPQWFYSWANFDGVHYLTIVEKGYVGTGLIQAFFPLYPILVSAANYIFDTTLLAGLFISNSLALVVCILLWHLVQQKFSAPIAWKTLVIFLLFPTSFYLGALYSESLFISLVLLTFIFAHHKYWLLAGLAALCASASRVVGVFLVPALVLEMILTDKSFPAMQLLGTNASLFFKKCMSVVKKNFKSILSVIIGLFGLFGYMLYLWRTFGDPLFFLHVQAEFGSGREETLVLLPQVFWRATKIILTVPFDLRWPIYLQELALTVGSIGVLLLSFKKSYKVPLSWTVFSLGAILLPTTTGTLSSMPRYVLVALPLFVILAQLRLPKYLDGLVYALLAGVLIYNIILFVQGYWVA